MDSCVGLALQASIVAGDSSRAKELRGRMGVITSWSFVGPFDNERGAGFDEVYAPERGFDPEAELAGKDRVLRWRRLDVEPPDGGYRIASLMQPARQSVAYFHTAIHASVATDARLFIGVRGGYRIELNGVEVGASNRERSFAPDQDLYPVQLAAGWNSLLVKVAAQSRSGHLMVRLTDGAGDGPGSWRLSSAFADLVLARKTRIEATVGQTPIVDAETELTSRAERGGMDLHALRLLVHLRLERRDDPEERRQSAAQIEKHLIAADRAPGVWVDLANAVDTRGRRIERDDNRRLTALRMALDIDSEHAPALVALARHYVQSFPVAGRATEFVARLVAAAPRDPRARLLATFITTRDRGMRAAVNEVRALRAKGIESVELMVWLGQQLLVIGRLDEASSLVDAAYASRPGDPRVRALRRAILEREERFDEIEAMSVENLARVPFDSGTYLRLAAHAEGRDDIDEALRLLMRGLEISPDGALLLRRAAEMNHRLGREAGRAGDPETPARHSPR